MAKLILLSGVPGSGKSYFSQTLKHVKGEHVYIISSDRLRKEMLGNPADMSADQVMWKMYYEFPKVYAIDKKAIVILDATNIVSSRRIEVVNKFKDSFDEIDLVYFQLPVAVVANQNIHREYPVPTDVLDSFLESYETPSEEECKLFTHVFVIKDDDIAGIIHQIIEDDDKLDLFSE